MTTFDQLVTRVRQQLLGYTRDQLPVTTLADDMTDSDTTFSVDTETVTAISRGLVEIGDELILGQEV